jgi:small subunit ribosomal protein S17
MTEATENTDLLAGGEGSASDEPQAARGGSEADAKPATSTEPAADADRARRKVREGVVVSNKMDKTAVVAVVDRVRHAKYNKFVLRTKKLYAHDEANDVNIGDRVRVMETRPLSKNKRWRVTEVLERAK